MSLDTNQWTEEEVDLDKSLVDLLSLVSSKEQLVQQLFACVHQENELKQLLPTELKRFSLDELKSKCFEQIKNINSKKLNELLNNKLDGLTIDCEDNQDSSSESNQSEPEKKIKMISKDSKCNSQDEFQMNVDDDEYEEFLNAENSCSKKELSIKQQTDLMNELVSIKHDKSKIDEVVNVENNGESWSNFWQTKSSQQSSRKKAKKNKAKDKKIILKKEITKSPKSFTIFEEEKNEEYNWNDLKSEKNVSDECNVKFKKSSRYRTKNESNLNCEDDKLKKKDVEQNDLEKINYSDISSDENELNKTLSEKLSENDEDKLERCSLESGEIESDDEPVKYKKYSIRKNAKVNNEQSDFSSLDELLNEEIDWSEKEEKRMKNKRRDRSEYVRLCMADGPSFQSTDANDANVSSTGSLSSLDLMDNQDSLNSSTTSSELELKRKERFDRWRKQSQQNRN